MQALCRSNNRLTTLVTLGLLVLLCLPTWAITQCSIERPGRFCAPVNGSITSPFGMRRHPITRTHRHHDGVDFLVPYGKPVKAFTQGKVAFSGWQGGYGRTVVIQHGQIDRIPTATKYAHLSKLVVAPGQWVKKGQLIAYSGSSGLSTGPHLHFEVIKAGIVTNPQPYLKQVVHTADTSPLNVVGSIISQAVERPKPPKHLLKHKTQSLSNTSFADEAPSPLDALPPLPPFGVLTAILSLGHLAGYWLLRPYQQRRAYLDSLQASTVGQFIPLSINVSLTGNPRPFTPPPGSQSPKTNPFLNPAHSLNRPVFST